MKSVFKHDGCQIFNRSGDNNASREDNNRIFDLPEDKIQDKHTESVYRTARYMQNASVKIRVKHYIYADDLIKPSYERCKQEHQEIFGYVGKSLLSHHFTSK